MSDVDKAVVILDHLGGCAREEVLCQPDAVRHDHGVLVALLKLRFAPHETVQSSTLECSWMGRLWLNTTEYSWDCAD